MRAPSMMPLLHRTRVRRVATAFLMVAPWWSAGSQMTFATRTSASAAAEERPTHVRAGERSSYDLRLAGRKVGTGSLEVLGVEQVHGAPAMHTVLKVSGGVLFAKVNDRFDSWIDADGLFSRRFSQDQQELTKTRHRDYDFSLADGTFREGTTGATEKLGSQRPLDDVAFLFYARSLPLNVGEVDTIPRYFKPGHDVILRVLRKERVTVPAGTFNTIVVQPTITNVGGLFGQGGQAEVYFSDDAARTMVMLRSKVPLVGYLSLHLNEVASGR